MLNFSHSLFKTSLSVHKLPKERSSPTSYSLWSHITIAWSLALIGPITPMATLQTLREGHKAVLSDSKVYLRLCPLPIGVATTRLWVPGYCGLPGVTFGPTVKHMCDISFTIIPPAPNYDFHVLLGFLERLCSSDGNAWCEQLVLYIQRLGECVHVCLVRI